MIGKQEGVFMPPVLWESICIVAVDISAFFGTWGGRRIGVQLMQLSYFPVLCPLMWTQLQHDLNLSKRQ